MTIKPNKISIGKVAVISAGVAMASAGAYYFLGPKGREHQKKARIWMLGMKTEIEEKLKKVKNITEPIYQNIVDVMAKTYSEKYKEHSKEIEAFAKKLKGEWKKTKAKTDSVIKKVKSITK